MIKKSFLTIVLILVASTFIEAQVTSIYSRFGIGDIDYSYSARRLGLSELGFSLYDSDYLNTANPASISSLRMTRLETAVGLKGITVSDKNNSGFYSTMDFSGFTFGFPIQRDYGIVTAFGLQPYSRVNYQIQDDITYSADPSLNHIAKYFGKGSISKLFLALSYALPFDMKLGASVDYYFGKLNYTSAIEFNNTLYNNSEYKLSYVPSGFGSTFGLITPDISPLLNSTLITELRLGGAASIMSPLNVDTSLVAFRAGTQDTIRSGKTELKIPIRIGAGMSITFSHSYLLLFDFLYQPWKEYEFSGKTASSLRDMMKLAMGFEYRREREMGSTYWEQIIWRAGLSYEQTQYQINGEGIDQYSFSSGFSLPLSDESSLDIGLQYAIRGTKDFNLIQENIFKINIGLNLGELWFTRQIR